MNLNPLWNNIFNKNVTGRKSIEKCTSEMDASDESVSTNDGGTKRIRFNDANEEQHDISILENDRITTRDMGQSRTNIKGRLNELLKGYKRGAIYFSGVRRLGEFEDFSGIIESISKGGSRCKFKFVIKHGDHLHIVHDCAFSNGTCRCFKFINSKRRITFNVPVQSLTKQDIEFIVEYHDVFYAEINSQDITNLFRGLQNLRSDGNTAECDRNTGNVEICNVEDKVLRAHGYELQNSPNNDESNETNINRNKGKGQRTKGEAKQEEIEAKILEILCVPIIDFIKTDAWLNTQFRFINNSSIEFKNAVQYVKLQFINKRIRDYKYFYNTRILQPHWDSLCIDDFNQKYLTKEKPLHYMKLLLINHYNPTSLKIDDTTEEIIDYNWKVPVLNYIRDLILFLDKKRDKMNTDCYISPPNAGKTLFFDCVRDFFVNVGQMSHWNRNSQFPLQMCGDTRLIFWNEPNYEQNVERSLLRLLGGDSLNAAQKNQNDTNIQKVSVIVTANNNPFPNKAEFQVRIKYHYWRTAPFLKAISGKKFHPLVLLELFTEAENYFESDLLEYSEKYTE